MCMWFFVCLFVVGVCVCVCFSVVFVLFSGFTAVYILISVALCSVCNEHYNYKLSRT